MIIVDDREKLLIQEFKRQGIEYSVQRLLVGDIVKGNIVIERKEASDFISSIMDGRILSQCRYMLENYERVFIIVHGELSQVYSSFNTHAILGMLASITARANIPILMVNSLSDVAYLSYKILEKSTDGKSFKMDTVIRSQNRDKRLDILTLIDGISLEKAKAIVERYPLFKGLVGASTEELASIKGVGPKLAGNIYSFFSIFRN